MTRPAKMARNLLLSVMTGVVVTPLGAVIASQPVYAAEPPPFTETIEMSVATGRSLGEVTALMDAQRFEEASAAMQGLRDLLAQGRLNDYEKLRVLQTAGRLHIALQKYPDAIADYEALLQLDNVPEAERLATTDVTGQLYLQLANWNKGLEYLLQVNDQQAGNNMETLFRLAFAYHQAGKVADAIPYMEQALVVGGDRAGEVYYSNMAVLYTAAANPAKAIATLEELIRKFPDSASLASYQQDLNALKARL